MPYLEIYPIENYADKISKQLDAVLEAKPTMYAKTKGRYKQLAYSLLQSVEKISAILEEESLISSHEDEFDELLDTQQDEFSDALKSIQEQISSYTEFTSNKSSSSKNSKNSKNSNFTPDRNQPASVSLMSQEEVDALTMPNKVILSRFAAVLEESSTHSFKCAEASQCARIIWQWFRARFTPEVRNYQFKYNMKQIPTWISAIIIAYGKHHSNNDIGTFVDMFNDWIVDITVDERNCWAVPYSVHQVMKEGNLDNFTLDAVVISDILMEEMYHQLTQPYMDNSLVYLESSQVPTIVKTHNPELTSLIRTRLSKQDDLILKCNLTYVEKEA